jgi:hypothetical protein
MPKQKQISKSDLLLSGLVSTEIARKEQLRKVMTETSNELRKVATITRGIKNAVKEWLKDGKDTREIVLSLQEKRKQAKDELKRVQEPYWTEYRRILKAQKDLYEYSVSYLGNRGIAIPKVDSEFLKSLGII